MNIFRRTLVTSLVVAVFAGLVQPPAIATPTDPVPPATQPAWSEPYPAWDGHTGLPADFASDPRFRRIVQDNADLAEDFEVRDAANAALAGDNTAIMAFLNGGLVRPCARPLPPGRRPARR
jgi:hypothetical protein